MSVQTNFRAQDMLGNEKPVEKKAAPAARVAAPAPKVEPVVAAEVVAVEEIVETPVVEEAPSED